MVFWSHQGNRPLPKQGRGRTRSRVFYSNSLPFPFCARFKRAFSYLFRRGCFSRFAIGNNLLSRSESVLLRDKKRAKLEQLVRLMAGELVCIPQRFHLAAGALSVRLETL